MCACLCFNDDVFCCRYRHENNRGLRKALSLLEPVREAHPLVGWADLVQMAGALAVEVTGGPAIRGMVYNRCDAPDFHTVRNTPSCPFLAVAVEPSSGRSGSSVSAGADTPANNSTDGNRNSNSSSNSSSQKGAAAAKDTRAEAERAAGVPVVLHTQETVQQPRSARHVRDRRKHLHMHSEDGEGRNVEQHAARLPQALPPYADGAPVPGVHIRNVFYRLGLSNSEIVALCGAHTIGRAFSDRSGVTEFSSGPQGATKHTRPTSCPWTRDGSASGANVNASASASANASANANANADVQGEGEEVARQKLGIGMAGGCSWTRNWLQFDNSYFRLSGDSQARRRASLKEGGLLALDRHEVERNPVSLNWVAHGRDPELLWLPTDNALQTDPEFRTHFELYGRDQPAFFRDYAAAHRKMSLLGARFDSLGPVSLE